MEEEYVKVKDEGKREEEEERKGKEGVKEGGKKEGRRRKEWCRKGDNGSGSEMREVR